MESYNRALPMKTLPAPSVGSLKDGDSAFRTSFETYLKGELENYFDATLSLLHRDLGNFVQSDVNGSERVYEFLVKELGYSSIEEASQAQQKRRENRKES